MKNGTCFRSFNIPVKISATTVCDDGMLMFIADYDTYKIRIIDLQRSREIDSLEGHESPVKHMLYTNSHLFTLSVDNELKGLAWKSCITYFLILEYLDRSFTSYELRTCDILWELIKDSSII